MVFLDITNQVSLYLNLLRFWFTGFADFEQILDRPAAEHGMLAPGAMQIELLADRPELVAELARLHFEQWGGLSAGETLEQRIELIRGACGRQTIPIFAVATDGAELLGSVALIDNDLESRAHLTPWLAALFVKPAYRGQGIASALVRYCEALARSLGVSTMYLYTPDAEGLYDKLGWTVIERCEDHGTQVVVMARSLASSAK